MDCGKFEFAPPNRFNEDADFGDLRLMRHFRPTLRHLYLLALFQLVGGPLVLLTVLGFSHVVVRQAAEHGVKAGMAQAFRSSEWQALSDVLTGVPSGQTESKVPGAPKAPQGKEGKEKWLFAQWGLFSPPLLREMGNLAASFVQPENLIPAWPHAPPSPPPRVA